MRSIILKTRMVYWILIVGIVLLSSCATCRQKAITRQLTKIKNYTSDNNQKINPTQKEYFIRELNNTRNLELMSLDPSVYKLVLKDLKRIKKELEKTITASSKTDISGPHPTSNNCLYENIISILNNEEKKQEAEKK